MKLVWIFLSCLIWVGCSSEKFENPAANAQTYTEDTFNDELNSILDGTGASSANLKLDTDRIYVSGLGVQRAYKIRQLKPAKTPEQVEIYRQAIAQEIARIDAFVEKYRKPFRLRMKDGDLKLLTLTDAALEATSKIKAAWQSSLDQMNSAKN